MFVHLLKIGIAFLLVSVIWVAVLLRWRRGIELSLLFMPIAGAVELWLYPAAWGVLVKDILFIAPAYIGFAMSGEFGSALKDIPKPFLTTVLLFAGIILVQAFNPDGPGLVATLIGLKVWLWYIPVFLLGTAYVRDKASLLRLSRLIIGLIWLPCIIGIIQWLLSLAIGYHQAIQMFYGAAAVVATQEFARFKSVGLMRIPSTFSFATQYLDYLLCMFVPVLGCASLEDNPFWRKLRVLSLVLICIAGFMTGERAAFAMIPIVLGVFYLLRRGALGILWVGVLVAAALIVVLSISGIDPTNLLQMETNLSEQYTNTQADEIVRAIHLTWIGRGVGTSTGAVRDATDSGENPMFEGYYAKAVAELGIAGCILAIATQLSVIILALRARSYFRGTELEPYCDAIAALAVVCLIYSYKGPIMSLDPPDSLYWLFAGMLFSFPRVARQQAAEKVRRFGPARGWLPFGEGLLQPGAPQNVFISARETRA